MNTPIDPAAALRDLVETCDRLEKCTYFDVGKDSIEAMRDAAAALDYLIKRADRVEEATEELVNQAEQMKGMFDDNDGSIQAAIEAAQEAMYSDATPQPGVFYPSP